MSNRWANFVLLLVLGIVLPLESAAQDADIAAIREVQMQQAQAWNRHDATAYAALFTADGDVVNVLGWRWRGRAEIESKLRTHSPGFRDSTLTFGEVDVRLLDPVTAVAHAQWTMDGRKCRPAHLSRRGRESSFRCCAKRSADGRSRHFRTPIASPKCRFPRARRQAPREPRRIVNDPQPCPTGHACPKGHSRETLA